NGTLNILELARIKDLKVVYTSSGAIYGKVRECAREDHPIRPGDMYGVIKAVGELAGEQYVKTYGIDYVAVRLYFIYGQTNTANFRPVSELFKSPVSPVDVISQFVFRAVRRERIQVESGGDSELDFTYVKDSAHGLVLAYYAKNPPHNIYNISTGKTHTLKEIVDIINSHTGKRKILIGPGKIEGWPLRAKYLDNSLAEKELGYVPMYGIERGIVEYYESIKAGLGQI
ncbi:MAG: NAD-dependent epimerase/dehydratase family protein, partial [Nitrososphaeria archaeon]